MAIEKYESGEWMSAQEIIDAEIVRDPGRQRSGIDVRANSGYDAVGWMVLAIGATIMVPVIYMIVAAALATAQRPLVSNDCGWLSNCPVDVRIDGEQQW